MPDKRGFVCASDDGVLSAVASLEAGSESDIRRATFALHGHSGFVTDCDTAPSGHAVLSSRFVPMVECFDCVMTGWPRQALVHEETLSQYFMCRETGCDDG